LAAEVNEMAPKKRKVEDVVVLLPRFAFVQWPLLDLQC
jgi:hypothetical protein